MSDIWNARNLKRRKWTIGWTEFQKNPTPDSENPMIQARNIYTKHTLDCRTCSMFGLGSEAKNRRALFCPAGFQMMKKYRRLREIWKHVDPNAFARTVVGGLLNSIREHEKKEWRSKQDQARRELDYNKRGER